jgi:hypothetical protein
VSYNNNKKKKIRRKKQFDMLWLTNFFENAAMFVFGRMLVDLFAQVFSTHLTFIF